MQLIIISGSSGSGKSTALHVLEDIGFICIDNLPTSLITTLAKHSASLSDVRYAISIDARNHNNSLEQLPEILAQISHHNLQHQILFFDATEDVLIQRFSETRRKHPLSNESTDLREAISKEQKLLKPVLDAADVRIDTSELKYHDLRDVIKRRFLDSNEDNAAIMFQSFGFKYGIPKDADLVFDVRCLPNPHWKPELRALTGKDKAVADFLDQQVAVDEMFQDIQHFLTRWLPRYQENNRSYITIAIGCTGGQHRSVYLCEKLSHHFGTTDLSNNIQHRHRELVNHG
ncbi:RNase adapter RapZ [Eionea flava]